MYCPKCGTEVKEGYQFCPNCGAKAGEKPKVGEAAAPVAQAPSAPQPAKSTGPTIDVKNIEIKGLEVVQLEETIDFKKAEKILEADGKKIEAFSGFFGKPEPSMIRVEELVMIYEPVHTMKATYEGSFEVEKNFPLTLDPGTVKFTFDEKDYKVEQPKEKKGFFSGDAHVYQMNIVENVVKKNEKALYFNLNGIENSTIKNFVDGMKTVPFDVQSHISGRKQLLNTDFDPSGFKDRVLVVGLVNRPPMFKKMLKEKITVEPHTIYVPKYRVLCKNLKNNQTKYMFFSAADGKVFNTETF